MRHLAGPFCEVLPIGSKPIVNAGSPDHAPSPSVHNPFLPGITTFDSFILLHSARGFTPNQVPTRMSLNAASWAFIGLLEAQVGASSFLHSLWTYLCTTPHSKPSSTYSSSLGFQAYSYLYRHRLPYCTRYSNPRACFCAHVGPESANRDKPVNPS